MTQPLDEPGSEAIRQFDAGTFAREQIERIASLQILINGLIALTCALVAAILVLVIITNWDLAGILRNLILPLVLLGLAAWIGRTNCKSWSRWRAELLNSLRHSAADGFTMRLSKSGSNVTGVVLNSQFPDREFFQGKVICRTFGHATVGELLDVSIHNCPQWNTPLIMISGHSVMFASPVTFPHSVVNWWKQLRNGEMK